MLPSHHSTFLGWFQGIYFGDWKWEKRLDQDQNAALGAKNRNRKLKGHIITKCNWIFTHNFKSSMLYYRWLIAKCNEIPMIP